MTRRFCTTVLLAALSLPGCAAPRSPADWAAVEDRTPAILAGTYGADASVSSDAAGRVALTWVTRDSLGATDLWLSVSRDSGVTFTRPLRVNERQGKVASYAESRPVATFGPSGALLVVWASARDSGEYASDIATRVSRDGGSTWGPERVINDEAGDPRSTYHGFASAAWLSDGRAVVAWIDGRATLLAEGEEEPHTAEIRLDMSGDQGASWGEDARVAGLVCPCCRLALRARGDAEVAIAYRGAADDLRDPRLVLSRDGGRSWVVDSLVSRDGWLLSGCPSTGPALELPPGTSGGQIAWFTAAGPAARVNTLAWQATADHELTLDPMMSVSDTLRDAARPMLATFDDQRLVGVLARPGGEGAPRTLALRRLGGSDAHAHWLHLGAGVRSAELSSAGTTAWAAWTEDNGEGPRVRLARLRLRL